jgi:hypothetical protein
MRLATTAAADAPEARSLPADHREGIWITVTRVGHGANRCYGIAERIGYLGGLFFSNSPGLPAGTGLLEQRSRTPGWTAA